MRAFTINNTALAVTMMKISTHSSELPAYITEIIPVKAIMNHMLHTLKA